MSKDEKEIRNKWLKFQNSQKQLSEVEKKEKVEEFHQIIKSMFGGGMRK